MATVGVVVFFFLFAGAECDREASQWPSTTDWSQQVCANMLFFQLLFQYFIFYIIFFWEGTLTVM